MGGAYVNTKPVIPAQVGIQCVTYAAGAKFRRFALQTNWIPACAGMTAVGV